MTDKKNATAAESKANQLLPGEKTVKIRLPRISKENPNEFVSVNERTWWVPRGIEVEVPECVAAALQSSEAMETERFEYEQAVQR